MDRRHFIKTSALAAVAAGVGLSSEACKAEDSGIKTLDAPQGTGSLKVRFLGTGAAGSNTEGAVQSRQKKGNRRSSILLDERIQVDMTYDGFDLLEDGFVPECVFYTHSHGDHYIPKAAVERGVKEVYLSATWKERAEKQFAEAAAELGKFAPKIIPLQIGETVQRGDISITALPANHCTSDYYEQALIYLIQKAGTRLLYATDTGGLMGVATKMSKIDGHVSEDSREPITSLIMEATMASDDDFRIFNHSSLEEVKRTVNILAKVGTYRPADGTKVYITHRSRSLHGGLSDEELAAQWPDPYTPARDGQTVYL